MKYLFDTDTITNLLKKRPSLKLVKEIKKLTLSQQFISSITVLEIVYGAYKSKQPQYHIDNLEKLLMPNVNVLNFDSKAAYVCGKLQSELDSQGIPLYLADIQIASIAIANQLILVTGNIKHFERIKKLKLENWI